MTHAHDYTEYLAVSLSREQITMLLRHAKNVADYNRGRLAEYAQRFPRPNAKQREWIEKRRALLAMAQGAVEHLEERLHRKAAA